MRFSSTVEPPEPMRGLEVPPEVVDALGAGKRPRVKVTLNGHAWSTRIAIMRGRFLIGLSHANRQAADVAIGDVVEVDVQTDSEPAEAAVPSDLAAALDLVPPARAAFDRLSPSRQRELVRSIEQAKKPETRQRRIARAVETLRDPA